jgi:tol-pal system protein YbgF
MLAPSVQGPGSELGEQDLYRTALNILLEQQPARYEESIGMFQSYIQRFPQGDRLTNSYYWLGAALLLVERYEEARDILTTLITSYPDDPKAASALLTRGEVYQRLGQRDLAEQDWRSIATRYPESATEIREADTRLRRQ